MPSLLLLALTSLLANLLVSCRKQGGLSVPIHPRSLFYKGWEFLSGILILYSTTLTPFIIVYLSEEEGWCQVMSILCETRLTLP